MPDASQPEASLIVLWTTPQDAEAFHQDYRQNHLPLVWKLPGLADARTWTLRSPGHCRLAELAFASRDELKVSFASPAGQALAEDTRRLEQAFGITAETHMATPEPSWRPGRTTGA